MGWWGYNIMEGDTPLDCEGDIKDFIADPALVTSAEHDGANWMEAMDAVTESAYNALRNGATVVNVMKAIQDGEMCSYDHDIAMQVLGEMVICSGGELPQEVRAACVAAAENELQYDGKGWRQEGEREKCLCAYIDRVWAYKNGEAIEPTSEGLFAKFAAA